ncbi:MAG: YiiD C-terminal domain-containing protein [Pseudomonadota bacterium]
MSIVINSASEWQKLIEEKIPLSQALGFSIESLTEDAIRCTAPLEPNLNVHNTGFAGSLYSLCTLTSWTLISHLMSVQKKTASVLLREGNIRYLKPVEQSITISAFLPEDHRLAEFISNFNTREKATLTLLSHVMQENEPLAEFCGEFVVSGIEPS